MTLGQKPWHAQAPRETLENLRTTERMGLSIKEAFERLRTVGKNEFRRHKPAKLSDIVARQFESPLVLTLLAAVIATLFLREYVDAAVIAVALLVNVAIGAFQEERASRAFEKLAASQARTASVLRGGERHVISAEGLVPGDVILLEAGAAVPADARLLSARDLSVNESALTGEWVAVDKETAPVAPGAPLAERFSIVFSGTHVASGTGTAVVVETGERTEFGAIAKELREAEDGMTPLKRNIRGIAFFLLAVIAVAIVLIFALGIFHGFSVREMFLTSIAVAVATMPEGLPVAVTIVLVFGMEAILKRGGLVRNLLAAETLGQTSFVLTDKTGTLTEAKMKATELITAKESHARAVSTDERTLLQTAVLASAAYLEEGGDGEVIEVRGRPVERAVALAAFEEGIVRSTYLGENEELDTVPFDSALQFSAGLYAGKRGVNYLALAGVPELLIERATYALVAGKRQKMTKVLRERFETALAKRTADGGRVLGVAFKKIKANAFPKGEERKEEILTDLTIVGLILLSDPIREDAAPAIALVRKAGARVVMVTGDNPKTALAVARETGIAGKDDEALTGKDIEAMDDETLVKALRSIPVFARVLPKQKLRIANVLKNADEVVAMTGDGINDSPALRHANIGIALGSGTEIAKEASDLVLLSDGFSVIVAAIEEGRKIFDNLRKAVAYLLSTSATEVVVIGGALVAGAPLPFLPVQLLWANVVQEGFMSFVFAFERGEDRVMERDPRSHDAKHLLTLPVKVFIGLISACTAVVFLTLFLILVKRGAPIEEVRTLMFVALTLGAVLFPFAFKNLRVPLWRTNLFDNRYLLFSVLGSTSLLALSILFTPLRDILSLTSISLPWLGLAFMVALANLAIIEFLKQALFIRPITLLKRPASVLG